MNKLLLAGAVLAMAATPALAQSYGPDLGVGTAPPPVSYNNGPARRPVNYEPGYASYGSAGASYGPANSGYGSYAMAAPGDGAYAMAAPVAAGPVVGPNSRCWVSTDFTRGFGYFGRCGSSNNDTDAPVLGAAQPDTSILPPR
jgi:hypothetical protein